MTPFLPPLDSMWRLTQDSASLTETVNSYYNWDFGRMLRAQEDRGKNEDYAAFLDRTVRKPGAAPDVLPAGTVIVFDRYHVSRSGEDQITIRIFASPNLNITPRKQGGKGKGKMQVYLSLADINGLGPLDPFTL